MTVRKQPLSEWRRRARVLLDALAKECRLANLPPAEFDRLVRAAYPWGERKMHPYKMWCVEAKAARERYRTELGVGKETPRGPRVCARMSAAADPAQRDVVDGEPGLVVWCDWCQSRRGGCLVCGPVRCRWRETWDGRRLGGAAAGAAADRAEAAMLADFLEERGWPDEAAWVRRNWVSPPKVRRRRKRKGEE